MPCNRIRRVDANMSLASDSLKHLSPCEILSKQTGIVCVIIVVSSPEAVPEKLSWVDPESEMLMSPPPCPKASPAASPSVTLVVRPPATSCPCLPVVSRFSKRLLSYLLPPSLLPKKSGVDMVIKVKQGICRRGRHSRILTRKVIGFGILLAHCWSPRLRWTVSLKFRSGRRRR